MEFPLKPYRFLIVDDFGSYRASLLTLLTEAQVPSNQIDYTDSGEGALELIAENHYDIILCDFYLGDEAKDGQQVLEESRARGILGYSTIFIMITAETARAMVLSVVENRPDDYLTKPFSRSVLTGRIERLVRAKEGLRAVDDALRRKSFKRALVILDQLIAKKTEKDLTLDELVEKKTEHPWELYRIKAEVLERNRYFEESLEIYNKTLEDQALLWAQMGKGRIHFVLEEYEEALACFEAVLTENDAQNVARDWSARTLMKMGQGAEAQKILEDAVEQSPKVLKRQKLLATIAQENGDLSVAKKAYENTVRLGTYSLFQDISDFTGLSEVLIDQGTPQDSLKILKKAKRSFPNDASAQIKTSLEEGRAYENLGRPADVDRMIKDAMMQFEKREDVIDPEVALQFANKLNENSVRLQSEADQATGLMQQTLQAKSAKLRDKNKNYVKELLSEVTQHNHNNEEIQSEIKDVIENSDLNDEDQKALNAARQEVINLNNEGVSYYKKGDVVSAADILFKAAERLHGNRVINLNAAQALLGMMVKQGVSEEMLERTDACLSRIPKEEHDDKYKKLHDLFEQFVQKLR